MAQKEKGYANRQKEIDSLLASAKKRMYSKDGAIASEGIKDYKVYKSWDDSGKKKGGKAEKKAVFAQNMKKIALKHKREGKKRSSKRYGK